jgi:exosortase
LPGVAPAAPAAPSAPRRLGRFAVPALATAAILWACWPTLVVFVQIWSTNPQYSHGFLVVPFAAFLLWHRRALFAPARRDRAWIGVALLLVGCGLKLVGGLYAFAWPDRVSVLFLVAGVFGTLGGWPALRWAWPALAFLAFLVPMPGRAETLLGGPLQKFATLVSTNILQTLGFFAQADGTVIILSEHDLGIVEACSGLRMLLAFVALSVAVAIVLDRPAWQRWAVVAGAVPVALACNVGRVVVTAIVLETAGKKWADLVFHDLAGWLMMPTGLALLWLELAVLSRLIVPDQLMVAPSAPAPRAKP